MTDEMLSKDGTFVAFKMKPYIDTKRNINTDPKTNEKYFKELTKDVNLYHLKIKHPDEGYLMCPTCNEVMY